MKSYRIDTSKFRNVMIAAAGDGWLMKIDGCPTPEIYRDMESLTRDLAAYAKDPAKTPWDRKPFPP